MALPPESLKELCGQASLVVTAQVEAIVAEGTELPPDSRRIQDAPGAIPDERSQVVRLRPRVTLRGVASPTLEAIKPAAPYRLSAGGDGPVQSRGADGVFFLAGPAADGRYEILCRYGPHYQLSEVEHHLADAPQPGASRSTRRWRRR